MKGRSLSAVLTQRVRGPETLAVGHLRLHSLRSLPEAPGTGNATPHTEHKGFPFPSPTRRAAPPASSPVLGATYLVLRVGPQLSR